MPDLPGEFHDGRAEIEPVPSFSAEHGRKLCWVAAKNAA